MEKASRIVQQYISTKDHDPSCAVSHLYAFIATLQIVQQYISTKDHDPSCSVSRTASHQFSCFLTPLYQPIKQNGSISLSPTPTLTPLTPPQHAISALLANSCTLIPCSQEMGTLFEKNAAHAAPSRCSHSGFGTWEVHFLAFAFVYKINTPLQS